MYLVPSHIKQSSLHVHLKTEWEGLFPSWGPIQETTSCLSPDMFVSRSLQSIQEHILANPIKGHCCLKLRKLVNSIQGNGSAVGDP